MAVEIYVPVHEKQNLTLEEAALYSNIGIERLRSLVSQPDCNFVLRIGNQKKLIKKKKFDEFIDSVESL